MNEDPTTLQLKHAVGELAGLRQVISFLYDGNNEAFTALYFIKGNYKEWPEIITWLKNNNKRGQDLVDFFKNESTESGGGYHLGVTYILSRIKGHKQSIIGIKGDQLL